MARTCVVCLMTNSATKTAPFYRGVRWDYLLGIPGCWAIAALLLVVAHGERGWHPKPLLVGVAMLIMPIWFFSSVLVWRCRRCRTILEEKCLDFPRSTPAEIAPYLELARRGEALDALHLLVGPVGNDTTCVRVESCASCREVARVTLGRGSIEEQEHDGKTIRVHAFRATAEAIAVEGAPVRVLRQ